MIILENLPLEERIKHLEEQRRQLEDKEFLGKGGEIKSRYRCEQINISRINGNTVTLYGNTKTQYLFSRHESEKEIVMEVLLEDYISSIEPTNLKEAFEFAQILEELVKGKIVFTQNLEGKFEKILNLDEIRRKWEKLRDNELDKIAIYKLLRSKAPKQADDIITTGNQEFSSSKQLGETLSKNLFFHILLRSNAGEKLKDYSLTQYSQLFPGLELTFNIAVTQVEKTEETTSYQLSGSLNRNNISEDSLKKMYDELYKPVIRYSYSEFDHIYNINYTIDNATNLLIDGKAFLCEKIKNNFEAITEFGVKRIEL